MRNPPQRMVGFSCGLYPAAQIFSSVGAALFRRLYFGSPAGYLILQAQGGPLMEFMGVSVGVLALICALVLLFGMQEARRILACTFAWS
jgi:hypothetical protein